MSASTGGYPLQLFLNSEHALTFACGICGNVCRDPVQLNCNSHHLFCNDCISIEPHTITTIEPIYYDANNQSNQLSVNDDYSNLTQIPVSTTTTTCPICNVSKCSRVVCPSIADEILLLSVQCINAHYGCPWHGTLHQHAQHACTHTARDCPFHVFGCPTMRVSNTELMTHFQTAQMEHLQLQINAITTLQSGQQQIQSQLDILNDQQLHLTTLITQYESKINQLDQQIQHKTLSPHSNENNFNSKTQSNLQFNINMNNNNDAKLIENNRWKNNPIFNKIVSIQHDIISTQSTCNTVNKIRKIAKQYTLSELSELFYNINHETSYLPTLHKKLCFIRGSLKQNVFHHNIFGVDLHNKQKFALLSTDDPIYKYLSWDVEFSALTVIQNINTKLFQHVIRDEREEMLFSLKHGLTYKAKKHHKNDSEREQYLQLKCNQEQKYDGDNNDVVHKSNCSVLLRCGGAIVSPNDNNNKTGTTQRVNGLVINTGDWISSLPNLKVARFGSTAVYSKHNGALVIGGKNDEKCLNVVEQWNMHKGAVEWDFLPTMQEERYSPCCSVLQNENNECLFVGGGYNERDKALKSCEMYNFYNGYWRKCSGMNVARYAGGCTVWNIGGGNGIVVGGGHNKRASKSVEQYDMYKDKWMALPDTNCKHRNGPVLWVCKEYGKFLSPFNGLLCIAGDIWVKSKGKEGIIDGYIEMYDYRDWRRQWFIVEDLRNILVHDTNAIIRGIIPFS